MSDSKMEKITGGVQAGGNEPTYYFFDTRTFLWSDCKCSYDDGSKVYGTISSGSISWGTINT